MRSSRLHIHTAAVLSRQTGRQASLCSSAPLVVQQSWDFLDRHLGFIIAAIVISVVASEIPACCRNRNTLCFGCGLTPRLVHCPLPPTPPQPLLTRVITSMSPDSSAPCSPATEEQASQQAAVGRGGAPGGLRSGRWWWLRWEGGGGCLPTTS